MLTDKKNTWLLILVLLISGTEVHAQLGGLLGKAKEKVTKAVEKKIDKNSVSEGAQAAGNSDNSSTVIGDSLLFAEDFTAFKSGGIATSFKTNGVATVTAVSGQKGK